jgi:hypothetical protein
MTRADDHASTKREVNSQTGTRHLDVRDIAPPTWLAMPVGLSAIGFTAGYLSSDILFFTSTVACALVPHDRLWPSWKNAVKNLHTRQRMESRNLRLLAQ